MKRTFLMMVTLGSLCWWQTALALDSISAFPNLLNMAVSSFGFCDYSSVTFTNDGDAPLQFFNISPGYSPDFLVSHACLSSLAVGMSCTVTIQYCPRMNRTSQITISANAGTAFESVSVYGQVVGL